MFEQVTLKDKNISEKALHLSLQKIYTHKQGNNHSLDRSEVAGSGKKLFKQKGTGNARAGNKKTTQRRGGGKAFGPKFHDVSFKVNKKVKKTALISSIEATSNWLIPDLISVLITSAWGFVFTANKILPGNFFWKNFDAERIEFFLIQ